MIETGFKLKLDNCREDDNELRMYPNTTGSDGIDFVTFNITVNGHKKLISSNIERPDDCGWDDGHYFHLSKGQIKAMIAFLQVAIDDFR